MEEILQTARTDRIATAVLAAQGGKGSDGQPIQITNPDEEVQSFDARLNAPLNIERQREALLREVRS